MYIKLICAIFMSISVTQTYTRPISSLAVMFVEINALDIIHILMWLDIWYIFFNQRHGAVFFWLCSSPSFLRFKKTYFFICCFSLAIFFFHNNTGTSYSPSQYLNISTINQSWHEWQMGNLKKRTPTREKVYSIVKYYTIVCSLNLTQHVHVCPPWFILFGLLLFFLKILFPLIKNFKKNL